MRPHVKELQQGSVIQQQRTRVDEMEVLRTVVLDYSGIMVILVRECTGIVRAVLVNWCGKPLEFAVLLYLKKKTPAAPGKRLAHPRRCCSQHTKRMTAR